MNTQTFEYPEFNFGSVFQSKSTQSTLIKAATIYKTKEQTYIFFKTKQRPFS